MGLIAIDETKPRGVRITDSGVNDGRVCRIFFAPRFDPWTERVR